MTLVKICGVKDQKTAQFSIDYGADAIGFVFAASKRNISIRDAKEIVKSLKQKVMVVGVFVNEEASVVNEIAKEVGLTHIQLHGDEDETYISKMNRPVWKSVSIKQKEDVQILDSNCEAFLFDNSTDSQRGGTGLTFPWEYMKQYENNKPFILAGGLHKGNVQEAINEAKPWMVDVSSGVEENGVKNIQKIKEFIQQVKGELNHG